MAKREIKPRVKHSNQESHQSKNTNSRIKNISLRVAQIICGILACISLIASIAHEPLLFLTLSSAFLTCSAWLIYIQDPNGYSMFLAGRFTRWIIGSKTYRVPNTWNAILWSNLTLFLLTCYLIAVVFRPS